MTIVISAMGIKRNNIDIGTLKILAGIELLITSKLVLDPIIERAAKLKPKK
tara:strand:- start:90 stop:242 length:153 start_codon:yes stop_codon:yes gene_type:complete